MKSIKKSKNYIRNFVIYLIIINSAFYIGFSIFKRKGKKHKFNPYSPEIKNITIGEGKSMKIGIISDIQLNGETIRPFYKCFQENLSRALKYFKTINIDLLIIAGDTTNEGSSSNYLLFNKMLYSIYTNYTQAPIVLSLMGNHEYLDLDKEDYEKQEIFFSYMKSYPYSHYIINNFNFIFWSNDNYNYDDSGVRDFTWIKSILEKARNMKKREGDPIFVITHMPPKKTVYGSEGKWGNTEVYNVLKNYPEVICISGHSHYSLRNIKSIWQKSFTAINTQSISYVDLDDYFQNAMDVRLNSAENDSMGLIAHLSEDNVIFDRIEFLTKEIMDERWIINFPINSANFIYNFEKRNKKIKPVFTNNNDIKIEKLNNQKFILFSAAHHDDYVYCYKLIFKGNNFQNDYFYYSDYYKNKKFRKEVIEFKLPNKIPSGKYDVEIYAIDSFNNMSEPKIGIINI